MDLKRRILLQGTAGAVAGLCFTPAPWRLLGDVTLRTQNAPWAPPVPHGELTAKASNCTLCPGGCAVNVRCVGAMPIGIQPAGEALCPAAFAAHHLAFHPMRLRTVLRRGAPSTIEEARKALHEKHEGSFAILDLAPGRTASQLHRSYVASLENGIYLQPPAIEGATAAAISRLLKTPSQLAIDIERTRTVLSLGTPIMEGWIPTRHLINRSTSLHIIQAEPTRTHTADLAAEYLPLRAGSELSFLLAIAGVLLRDKPGMDELRNAVTLQQAAERTGLSAERIESAAFALLNQPAIVLADRDPANGPHPPEVEAVAAALNVLLDSGAFVAVPGAPAPAPSIASLPDASIGVLVIDEPLPGGAFDWSLIQPKLRKDARIFASTWTRAGVSRNAEWLIPVPVYLESLQDAPQSAAANETSFRLSRPILQAPKDATECAALLDEKPYAQRLEERAAAIHAAGRGWLTKSGEFEPVAIAGMESKDFWTALQEGGRWHDTPPPSQKLEITGVLPEGFSFTASSPSRAPRVAGWRPAASSPLLGKLWQDTDLKQAPGAPLGVRS